MNVRSAAALLLLPAACATPKPAVRSAPPPIARASPASPPAREGRGLEAIPETPLPAPGDALEALYARRINFSRGEPTVTVRLMEGQRQVAFSPRSEMRLRARGGLEKTLSAPPGTVFQVRVASADKAELGHAVQVGELAYADKEGLARLRALWRSRGFPVEAVTEGAMYGIAGHVLDNRRVLVLLGPHGSLEAARALQDQVAQRFGEAAVLHATLLKRPSGVLEVLDAGGTVLAEAQDLVVAEDEGDAGFEVKRVEHGVGYAFHGFADRRYRGSLLFTLDQNGLLAVINAVPLEELLRGLVPSEIFPSAPAAALEAQAVTARGEVLAKIGVRHLTDPYLFCSEQHCQVYQGEGSATPATDAAIRATQGEALFIAGGGPLVDTVYSAVCGGYTESNENVWNGPPDPALRGVPDLLGDGPLPDDQAHGLTTASLPGFLASRAPFACKLSSRASASKFRWQRRFTALEVDALLAPLEVGHVVAMRISARGVSGRAVALTVSGDLGAGELRGELNIRKAFKNLPSAMFTVAPEEGPRGGVAAWIFSGGGWGHGVGMCQLGAVGRAEHGETYRQILQHYFQHSELVKIY